jgi:branched-chain amino acid transport system permease protein
MRSEPRAEAKALSRRLGIEQLLAVAGVVAFVALGPFLDDYWAHVFIIIFFYAYLGLAWNILAGYAGQFSFGHATFFGIGAYTSTALFVHYGISPWFGMVAGALLALATGLFIGYLTFRSGLRGAYFALATLAFAEMFYVVATNWDWVGAGVGMLVPLVNGGDAPLYFEFASKQAYYYIALLLAVGAAYLTHRVERSKAGYYFAAIRENEAAAAAIGVNTFAYKMRAMALSAPLTAIGGTFYAQYFSYIDPLLTFGVGTSVEIILRPIVGGTGTVLGPILGSFLLTPLGELTRNGLRELTGARVPGADLIVFGAILIAVIIFMPHGIVGWLERPARRLLARFQSDAGE